MKFILHFLSVIIFMMNFDCQKAKEEGLISNGEPNKNDVINSIDTSSMKLPTDFTAIDPIDLFESLTNLDIYYHSKEEFETTEEYKTRIHSLIDKAHRTPIKNNLTIDSLFTIQLEDNLGWLSYDADKEIMKAGIGMSSSDISNIKFESNIFEEDLEEICKNFENSAVFLVDIKEGMGRKYWYALEFSNYSEYKKYFGSWEIHNDKSLVVELHMKRDYAQKEKENLRLIATIKIIEPWYNSVLNPYSKDSYYKLIFANVVQFWIYNYKTGEIYFKIKA